jgi:hypothetical protein
MLFIRIFSVFRLQPLCAFISTYANSWIKSAARQNIIRIRFGNRRAVRRWQTGAEMALTAIGEISQWGVVGCSGSRTLIVFYLPRRRERPVWDQLRWPAHPVTGCRSTAAGPCFLSRPALQTIFHLCIPKKDLAKPHLTKYFQPFSCQNREQHLSNGNYEITVVQEIYIPRLEQQVWPQVFVISFSIVYIWDLVFGIEV